MLNIGMAEIVVVLVAAAGLLPPKQIASMGQKMRQLKHQVEYFRTDSLSALEKLASQENGDPNEIDLNKTSETVES